MSLTTTTTENGDIINYFKKWEVICNYFPFFFVFIENIIRLYENQTSRNNIRGNKKTKRNP